MPARPTSTAEGPHRSDPLPVVNRCRDQQLRGQPCRWTSRRFPRDRARPAAGRPGRHPPTSSRTTTSRRSSGPSAGATSAVHRRRPVVQRVRVGYAQRRARRCQRRPDPRRCRRNAQRDRQGNETPRCGSCHATFRSWPPATGAVADQHADRGPSVHGHPDGPKTCGSAIRLLPQAPKPYGHRCRDR